MQTSTLMKPLMILCLLSLLFDSVQTIDDFLCGSVGQCNCRFGGPGDVLLVACNLVSMERLPVECDAVHKEVDLSGVISRCCLLTSRANDPLFEVSRQNQNLSMI